MKPQHPFEVSEGLGEVLQLVMEVDVLLYQRMDCILQFKTLTFQHQQRQGYQQKP